MYVLGSGLQVYVKVCVYFARVRRHTHRAQWWMHDNTWAIGFVTSPPVPSNKRPCHQCRQPDELVTYGLSERQQSAKL
jgi:hypothetical protein